MSQSKTLTKLRKRIPFLNKIPDEIFFNLDASELYLPNKEINMIRTELENKLDHHVMTYKSTGFNLDIPIEKHLCSYLKTANLTNNQLKILQNYEKICLPKGVSFGVYQKPLILISPSESEIYKLYKEKGLL